MDTIFTFLLLITGTKFIATVVVSFIGGYIRILQRPFADNMTLFFIRILFIITGGGILFLIVENEHDLFILIFAVGILW